MRELFKRIEFSHYPGPAPFCVLEFSCRDVKKNGSALLSFVRVFSTSINPKRIFHFWRRAKAGPREPWRSTQPFRRIRSGESGLRKSGARCRYLDCRRG